MDANPADQPRRNVAAMRARAGTLRVAARSAKLTSADQIQVAQNLWGILAHAEGKGITRATVLQKAGKSTRRDSTKRLPRYALDPELSEEEKKHRAGSLTKSAAPYLEIAEAAGILLDGDKDVFVADLFARTRIGETTHVASETDDIYAELAGLVCDICRGIVRKHDLATCARHIETWRMCRFRNALRECRWIRWSSVWQGIGTGSKIGGLEESEGGWSLPYPSVLVGWGIVMDGIPFRVSTETTMGPGVDERMPLVGEDGNRIHRLGKLVIEVRLALLPVGPGGSIEPAFVTRLRTCIKLGRIVREADGRLNYAPFTDPPASSILPDAQRYAGKNPELEKVFEDVNVPGLPETIHHRTTDGVGRFIVFELDAPSESYRHLVELFEGVEEQPRCLEDDAAGPGFQRVELVSAASCRRLLSLKVAEGPETHVQIGTAVDDRAPTLSEFENPLEYWSDLEKRTDLVERRDEYASRAEPFTLGEALEFSLLFADGGPADPASFDVVLDGACSRVAAEVAARAKRLEDERAERKAIKRQAWASEPSAAPGN